MQNARHDEIWALHDGRAGHASQSLALAEALARRVGLSVREIPLALTGWAAAVPPPLWPPLLAGGGFPAWAYASGAERLTPPYPAMAIGAGRRAAPALAALKRLAGVPVVQILNPGMPYSHFDAVILPAHDGRTGTNVHRMRGALSRWTPALIAEAAREWDAIFASLPRPRVAILVGGPSRSARFGEKTQAALVERLHRLRETESLLITPSRRTPDTLRAALSDLQPDFLWDGDGANPYPAILGHAERALVTTDSISMAVEAAAAGLPTELFPVDGLSAKHRRFVAAFGAERPCDEANRLSGILSSFLRGI